MRHLGLNFESKELGIKEGNLKLLEDIIRRKYNNLSSLYLNLSDNKLLESEENLNNLNRII